MKAIAIERRLAPETPTADLDAEVVDRLREEIVLAAFWHEEDDGFVVTTVFSTPELRDAAKAAGQPPRALFGAAALEAARPVMAEPDDRRLGVLSERFESRGDAGAIGFDRHGGHSYGLYQLASRMNQVRAFIAFLTDRLPEFAARLEAAGGDPAARRGDDAFKRAWRELAADPDFAAAQHAYIKSTHYDPFCAHVRDQIGLDVDARSFAVRNVAWSTAVQHGPRNGLFRLALDPDAARREDRDIIERVYGERSRVDVHFRSSTEQVRESVRRRFERERADALAMLA